MENEQLVIGMKSEDKMNTGCECCVKTKMCRKMHKKLESRKTASIMEL